MKTQVAGDFDPTPHKREAANKGMHANDIPNHAMLTQDFLKTVTRL